MKGYAWKLEPMSQLFSLIIVLSEPSEDAPIVLKKCRSNTNLGSNSEDH